MKDEIGAVLGARVACKDYNGFATAAMECCRTHFKVNLTHTTVHTGLTALFEYMRVVTARPVRAAGDGLFDQLVRPALPEASSKRDAVR